MTINEFKVFEDQSCLGSKTPEVSSNESKYKGECVCWPDLINTDSDVILRDPKWIYVWQA